MRSGMLRDRVEFEERTITPNAQGGNDIGWGPGFHTWCHPERTEETACQFIIRYRPNITPASHRILWDGAIWTIVNCVHDLKRRMLTITCDLSNLIDATHLLSTETEYVDAVPVIRPQE